MRPKFMGWCHAAEDRLKQLVAAGGTAGTISKEFGTTRNAILGKCDRMGLVLREAKRPDTTPRRLKDLANDRGAKAGRASSLSRPGEGYVFASPPRRFSWEAAAE